NAQPAATQVRVTTLHSLALRTLRAAGLLAAYPVDPLVMGWLGAGERFRRRVRACVWDQEGAAREDPTRARGILEYRPVGPAELRATKPRHYRWRTRSVLCVPWTTSAVLRMRSAGRDCAAVCGADGGRNVECRGTAEPCASCHRRIPGLEPDGPGVRGPYGGPRRTGVCRRR